MRFILIGGLGYIGQVLQDELKKKGHAFTIIDNDLMRLHPEKEYEKLDILNYEDLKKISEIIANGDVVVNMAAIVGDQACLVDTKLALKTNCQGIQHIVEICNRFNKKIVHLSSCSLYGSANGLLTEESPIFPVDFYGQTKYQQERYVFESAKDHCVLRLGTAYGYSPRMRFDLVANTFTAQAFFKEKLVVFGGNQWRPFVHIRDIARAIIFATEKNLKGIYNISNENITIAELAKKIPIEGTKMEINDMQTDPRNYKVDNSKILNEGFRFEWNLKKGMEEMIRQLENIKDYREPKYSNYKMQVLLKL